MSYYKHKRPGLIIFLIIFTFFTLPGFSVSKNLRKPLNKSLKTPINTILPSEKTIILDKIPVKINSLPTYKERNLIERDVKILEQQVNLITREFYESKEQLKKTQGETSKLNSGQNELIEQNNYLGYSNKNMIDLLLFISGFLLIAFISLLFWFNKSLNKIKIRPEDIVNDSKEAILKEISEGNFIYTEMEKNSSDKLNEFSLSLENNYNKFLDSVNGYLEINKINFEKDIKAFLNNNPELKNPEIIEEIKEMITQVNNLPQMVENELSKYVSALVNTEKQLISNFEKANLANNHFNMGNIFLKLNQYPEAVHEYNEAIKIDNKFYGAYLNLGKAYEKNKQVEEAFKTYKQAINLRPDHFKAYFNIANLLRSRNKFNEAIFSYKKALELKPDYFKAYNNLGITYQKLNKLEKAKEQFQKAINYNKDYPDAYINLSNVDKILRHDETELYPIAEMYMKQFNASVETSSKVKQLIKN